MPFLKDEERFLLMDNPLTAPQGEAVFDFTKRTQERHPHITEDDLRKLRDVGIQTTMPFLCLWNEIEPTPNHYDWKYLDDYCNRAARVGMKVILFTCTGGYPDWMPDDYFVQCKLPDGTYKVHREALSPWSVEAMQMNNDFTRKLMQRYSCDNILLAIS